MKYVEFKSEFKSGKFRPVYFFYGKEDFLAEKAMWQIVDKLMPSEDDRSLNFSLYYGDDANSLPNDLASPPVFAKLRMIVIKKTEALSAKLAETVLAYCKKPPSDTVLIMLSTDGEPPKKFIKELLKVVEPIECNKLKDKLLSDWIKHYIKEKGKTLDNDALVRLSSIIWPNLRELAFELDGLTLMAGEKPNISLADIEAMGGATFALDRWRLNDAIVSGDVGLVINLINNFLYWSFKPVQLVGDLYRMYQTLWIIKLCTETKKTDSIRKMIFLPDFKLKQNITQAKEVKLPLIERGLLRIQEADLNIKRGLRKGEVEIILLATDLTREWKR